MQLTGETNPVDHQTITSPHAFKYISTIPTYMCIAHPDSLGHSYNNSKNKETKRLDSFIAKVKLKLQFSCGQAASKTIETLILLLEWKLKTPLLDSITGVIETSFF